MGLFSIFMDSISKGKVSNWLPDFDIDIQEESKEYIRKLAESTVFNFVGRTMSTMEVRFDDDVASKNEWEYKLNVRPNGQESAVIFWQKFFVRLLRDNEALIIMREDELLLADDFYLDDTTDIHKAVFQSVVVNGYGYTEDFSFDDVIYLKYSEEGVETFTHQLFKDYGKLFERTFTNALRNNQVRAAVKIEQTGKYSSDGEKERMESYIRNLFNSFEEKPVAIVPLPNGMSYEEFTNKVGSTNQPLNELNELKKSLIDDLANAVGIPTALLYGEKAEMDSNIAAYRETCINPLVKKIQVELMLKTIKEKDIKEGKKLKVNGVLPRDPFSLATQIDKLISSGFFAPNEAREKFELEKAEDKEMDEHYITKNYQTTKGGENEDDGS